MDRLKPDLISPESGNSHVESEVVRYAIPVVISDVVDGAYCQDDLTDGVHDGQIDNCPGEERERESRERDREGGSW